MKYSHFFGILHDPYLNKSYDLARMSAAGLSEYLKANLKAKKIDYHQFVIERDMEDEAKNPPTEIYEYQNFFLMERADGELVLLDGFRRLLYCTPPDHNIFVRIYKEADMSHQEIMKLMVYLNHFKFYGISNYYDRGFALTMYVLFGINIPKFIKMFDAYLRYEDEKSFYNSTERSEGKEAIVDVTTKLIDPLFIDNMIFLSDFAKTKQMSNKFFAIQFREFMEKYKKPITAKAFLDKVKGEKLLPDLLKRYEDVGTRSSSDSTKIVRQITQIYDKVFNSFLGIETGKTYTEVKEEMKAEVAKLKKDKTLLKLTKIQRPFEVMDTLIKAVKDKKKMEFVMVVHPYDDLTFGHNREVFAAEPGVYTTSTVDLSKSGHGLAEKPSLKIYLMDGEKKRAFTHLYWGSYGGKTRVFEELEGYYEYFKNSSRAASVKVDLFVRKFDGL